MAFLIYSELVVTQLLLKKCVEFKDKSKIMHFVIASQFFLLIKTIPIKSVQHHCLNAHAQAQLNSLIC